MPPTPATHENRVAALAALDPRQFATTVYNHVVRDADHRGPATTAALRDPRVIARTLEALDTLIATNEAGIEKMRNGDDEERHAKIRFRHANVRVLVAERDLIAPLVHRQHHRTPPEPTAETRSARQRAMVRLAREPDLQARFLALVREERARDAEEGRD